MVWLYLILNTYFDYIIAALLAVLFAFVVANLLSQVYFRRITLNFFLERLLKFSFVISLTTMVCLTWMAARTDPDFSPGQRYRQAFRTIKNWMTLAPDSFLARGGMEKALSMDTQWVAHPEKIFYTVGARLYSVRTDGSRRQSVATTAGEIKQAIFSPDGSAIVLKTHSEIVLAFPDGREATTIYRIPAAGQSAGTIRIRIGGIQWSPDSRKICFFLDKTSAASSQTQWFVYDGADQIVRAVSMGMHQDVYLNWSRDSRALYFSQRVGLRSHETEYQWRWFEVPLETLKPRFKANIRHRDLEVPDEVLQTNGILLVSDNPGLRFESPRLFARGSHVMSPTGRRLWVNRQLQLCYQSAYGVQFSLFGLSRLGDYLMFPPHGREAELTVLDLRWLPSDRYVLIRHYTHGLLVLDPVRRRVGILVQDNIGIFGAYPG